MRSLSEIRAEIEQLTQQRADLFHKLAEGHDRALADQRRDLEEQIAALWEEHRIARVHLLFGERELIIQRARVEERLARAA